MILQLRTSTVLACVLCNPILVAGKTIGKPKIKWIGFGVFELELKTETLTAQPNTANRGHPLTDIWF